VNADQRVTAAREYLAGARRRKLNGLTAIELARECAELRRIAGQLLDVIAELEQPAPDTELGQLAADHPGWRVWLRPDGVYVAWRLGTRPPHLLHAADAAGLGEALEAEGGDPDAS
jgi:hypothetical protein